MATAMYVPETSSSVGPEDGVNEWLDRLLIIEFHEAGLWLEGEQEEMALRQLVLKNFRIEMGLPRQSFGALVDENIPTFKRLGRSALSGFGSVFPGIGKVGGSAVGAVGGLFGALNSTGRTKT